MSRWKPLSESLDPDVRLLVEQLRRLKERTGLSLVELARGTPYSKSAWHRYLNGSKFPPRQAVEALGMIAGADAARLMGLWGLAERGWSATVDDQQAAPVTAAGSGDGRRPEGRTVTPAAERFAVPPRLRARRNVSLALAGVALLTGLAMVFAIGMHGSASPQRRFAASTAANHRPAQPPAGSIAQPPACRGLSCEGQYPTSSGCEHDARTEGTVTVAGRSIELRFSASCEVAWAEVSPYSSDVRDISISEAGDDRLTALPDSESRGRSPMLAVPGPQAAEACGVVMNVLACVGCESAPGDTAGPADRHDR